MAWADHAARLDTEADDRLGDTISYADDGSTFVDTPGFLIFFGDDPEGSPNAIDPTQQGWRVKIRRDLVPKPHNAVRLRHSRLGGATFKPTNSQPSVQGRYWLFEIKAVS